MKKNMVAAFLLGANFALAQAISPITAFTPGNYLGQGSYLSDNDMCGCYSNLTNFETNGWSTVLSLNNLLYYYKVVVSIDDYGFLSVQVTDNSVPDSPVINNGVGNCGDYYCNLTVALSNGVMQETIIFNTANNTLKNSGAIFYNDDTPNVQWESSSSLMAINSAALGN